MLRQHARHAVVGVEAQDVFEDDTGVAELPWRLVAPTTTVNETDGVSEGDAAEPCGWPDVGVRHGVEDRRMEQVALSA